jgi:hypothetical protein
MKAMLPPPPPPSAASKPALSQKKRGGGGGGVNSVSFAPPSSEAIVPMNSTAPTRAAGEYNPPNAFVNAVSGGLGEDPHRKKNVLEDLFNF